MLPSVEKFYKDAEFLFPQDLASAHSAKTTTKWLTDRVFYYT